ncbi:MAG: Nif3-like dinuclear metal center hexameric protein [Candidatus Thorarchaeota archaeon]|nr:Nif3-like dinuclear metal center hexameric protein [Candidatus Thorarchaeota archaeon]
MTTLHDIVKHLEALAPRDYTLLGQEGYVEVGPSIRSEQTKTTINRVVVTTYPSSKAVAKASQEKANLLISYRPMFKKSIRQISGLDLVRIRLLAKNYISSYVVGSAWISAKDGLTDALVDALNLRQTSNFNIQGPHSTLVPIGRFCELPSIMNHSGFANYIASKLEIPSVTFTGRLDDDASQVLVCAGFSLTEDMLLQSLKENVKTVVSGEISPEVRFGAYEYGMNIYELGAFHTEKPGMMRLRHQLSLEYPELKIEFVETESITQSLKPYTKNMA